MTHYEQLAAGFHRRIDCIAGAVDALAPGLDGAAQQIVSAVLDDRRILLCGTGPDSSLARYGALLLRRPGDAMPTLPALLLGAEEEPLEQLWQDVRCLARDGDILLCIDSSDNAATAGAAAKLAAQRNLIAVLLSAENAFADAIAVELRAADAELRRELALMAVHELRSQVLRLLMGE